MPLYEYECDACGERFEKIQKFSDPLVDICPKCGGKVRKLISSPAIQFKGTGWYITDYAKKSGSVESGKSSSGDRSSSGDQGGEKSGEKSGEKKSESSGDTGAAKSSSDSSSGSGSTSGSTSEKSTTKTP
jgi:putative FmdB family regulatory protein